MIGTTLGGYRIIEQIGMGGMATVYKAYQPSMERYVALKVLPSHYAADPKFVKRFIREARTIAQLEHRHILPVYDFGEENGITYLVMRYLEGGTLKEVLAQGRPTLSDIAELLTQICAALDYAHRRGVVHRDVKPANIMIDDEGCAYLADFGIAKVLEGTVELTEEGVGIGTPAYMAPEQSLGQKVDGRTDIYALGVILYEMVVGRPPYEADTPMAVALAHIHAPLPLPREVRPDITEPIEAVIIKALAKDPADRFQTADELAQAFKQGLAESGSIPPETTLQMLLSEARATRVVPVRVSTETEAPAQDALPAARVQPERRPFPLLAVGIGLLVVLVVGGIALVVILGPFGREAAEVDPYAGIPPFDNFDDLSYDGDVNSELWDRQFEPAMACDMVQHNGALSITNTASDQQVRCALIARSGLLQPLGSDLESTEARMQILSDHNGVLVGTVISFNANFPEGIWHAQCGIYADDVGGNSILFEVIDERLGEEAMRLYGEAFPVIQHDHWYTIRLEVDPDTMTFSCLIDGQTVGSYTPENVVELREARFEHTIYSWREPGALGTVLLDDFRLSP